MLDLVNDGDEVKRTAAMVMIVEAMQELSVMRKTLIQIARLQQKTIEAMVKIWTGK